MIEYLKLNNLKAGQMLAKTIYDENGRPLIKCGHELTDRIINVLKDKEYRGAFIEHNGRLGRFIPIPGPVIDEYVQIKITSLLKKMYDNKAIKDNPYDAKYVSDMKEIEEEVNSLVDALYEAYEENDLMVEILDGRNKNNWLFYHSLNTCIISASMAIVNGLEKGMVQNIAFAAIMHDMGKAWIDDDIINKKNLSENEKKIIQKHSDYIFRFLQVHNYPIGVTYGVWQHHEKMTGTGYPNKLVPEKIIDVAKIIAIASTYDNLVNKNPQHENVLLEDEALEMLNGKEEYDVEYRVALTKVVMPYTVGARILLSNGRTGLVLKNNCGLPLRPVVNIDNNVIDLANDYEARTLVVRGIVEDKI